jgi:hypothetical protein
MGGFLPADVSQIEIFCNLACSLARVLYSVCKRSVQSDLRTAFCTGCTAVHIHQFLCTLQVVDCDELVLTVF